MRNMEKEKHMDKDVDHQSNADKEKGRDVERIKKTIEVAPKKWGKQLINRLYQWL